MNQHSEEQEPVPGAAQQLLRRFQLKQQFLNKRRAAGERDGRGRQTCRQKVFPVSTRDGGRREVLVSEDCLFDDVQTIPDGQYS